VIAPERARKTIWSESPDCAGKLFFSRSSARCDSVPLNEKLLLKFVPIELDAANVPTRATSQPIRTTRRCPLDHAPRRATMPVRTGCDAVLELTADLPLY
jgi:hypothetical protein